MSRIFVPILEPKIKNSMIISILDVSNQIFLQYYTCIKCVVINHIHNHKITLSYLLLTTPEGSLLPNDFHSYFHVFLCVLILSRQPLLLCVYDCNSHVMPGNMLWHAFFYSSSCNFSIYPLSDHLPWVLRRSYPCPVQVQAFSITYLNTLASYESHT